MLWSTLHWLACSRSRLCNSQSWNVGCSSVWLHCHVGKSRHSSIKRICHSHCCFFHWHRHMTQGLLRELNPGPLAPEARIIPLDQAASWGTRIASGRGHKRTTPQGRCGAHTFPCGPVLGSTRQHTHTHTHGNISTAWMSLDCFDDCIFLHIAVGEGVHMMA